MPPEDADYPIRVAVRPGRLNRLAVLFRFFLMIPAWIVASVVSYGAFTLVQFVSWLIVLISGQMPDALYQALAAALRYQIPVYGFAFMLTSAYPSGLYGDLAAGGYLGQPVPEDRQRRLQRPRAIPRPDLHGLQHSRHRADQLMTRAAAPKTRLALLRRVERLTLS
jgi:hypothetical protein